jgi:hypothetical protein
MTKINSGWKPTMEQRAGREDRQVKCLIASGGHMWMCSYFDCLPAAVRRRLRDSRFNICPACMTEEAQAVAAGHHLKRPTVSIYLATIAAIERKLQGGE